MIRCAEDVTDLETWAAIKNVVQPAEPVTAGELLDEPGARFLLHGDVGCAVVKRSSLVGCAFAMVRVLPSARREGVGSALLDACSGEGRALGVDALYGRVDGGDEESLRFVRRRGSSRSAVKSNRSVISARRARRRRRRGSRSPSSLPSISRAPTRLRSTRRPTLLSTRRWRRLRTSAGWTGSAAGTCT